MAIELQQHFLSTDVDIPLPGTTRTARYEFNTSEAISEHDEPSRLQPVSAWVPLICEKHASQCAIGDEQLNQLRLRHLQYAVPVSSDDPTFPYKARRRFFTITQILPLSHTSL